ncbi:MAG: ATP-binding cassette domain-containing protein [Ilumatobacter sp.]
MTNRVPPAIVAESLSRTFGDEIAVDRLDLEVRHGEIYGFLGPNGAGKSTTVRMLCTLLAPTSGRAAVAGFDVVADPGAVRLRIGAALQEAALDPVQTGRQLLRLQGRLYGLSTDDVAARLTDLMELIELGDAIDRPIATYSGGMRRRLDLAASLIHNPEVLFLDEPTTGLDPASRTRVWQEVRRLNEQLDMTILLTTQYLEEADELADRVGIIDGGRLVAEGTPDELKRRVGYDVIVAEVDGETDAARTALADIAGIQGVEVNGTEVMVLAEDGSAMIGPVAIALNQHDVTVRNLQLRTPTLDDVFLDLTGTRIRADDAADPDLATSRSQEVPA